MTTRHFQITGMHCASCGLLVDETLEDLPGIVSSTTNVRTGRATVDVEPGSTAADDAVIVAAVTALGYTCRPCSAAR